MTQPFFHVTHKSNVASIARSGLNPAFSKGHQQTMWYVLRYKLEWAIAHVAERQHCDPADLVVYRLWGNRIEFTKTRLKGVYITADRRRPTKAPHSASAYLDMDLQAPYVPGTKLGDRYA